MDTYVYFVLAEDLNRVKIGITTNVEARVSNLKSGCPCELRLIYYFLCSKEKEIHSLFKHLRIKGEWFKYNEEIKTFINALKIVNDNFVGDDGNICIYYMIEEIMKNNNIKVAKLICNILNSFIKENE